MTTPTEESLRHSYTISTVSTLTGVDQNTIRAWERRYGAITPIRTESGRRRYDDEAIARLQLLKALVDSHVSIGSIANLPNERLRERLTLLADRGRERAPLDPAQSGEASRVRLALLAPALERRLRTYAGAFPELEYTVATETGDSLLQAARQNSCGVLVLELDADIERPVDLVRNCRSLPGSPVVVVLYQFERRAALARLAQAGAYLVQSPVRLEQLRRVILDLIMIDSLRGRTPAPPPVAAQPAAHPNGIFRRAGEARVAPPRRFDDEQLAQLVEIRTGIDCECPNHLSTLVSGLVAFEHYSRTCESRDEADAKLHRMLADGTAQARAQMESLLAVLCEQEGIKL